MVLYCNFTSLAFLGLLGFLRRPLKIRFIATAKSSQASILKLATGMDLPSVAAVFLKLRRLSMHRVADTPHRALLAP